MFDVIIIGGGASGIMCAIKASDRGKSVLLIDGDIYPGKKLMVTGNGKCNLTNHNISSNFYNQNIDDFLQRFDQNKTLKFFNELGLICYADDEGRCYPYSRSARSVIDVLNEKLKKNKVNVFVSEKVVAIEKNAETYNVLTESNKYMSKNVVIAIGTFTNNLCYKNFKIDANDFCPSLCALKSENLKKLSGTRLSDVEVVAKCNGKEKKDRGEVLFKDDGLSGIVIFNLSSLFAREKTYRGKVCINLMPDYSREEIIKILNSRISKGKDLFKGWFADEIASLILKKANVDRVNSLCVEKLVSAIVSLEFDICGYYSNQQVHSGGISLSSLTKNLESKKYKGLYFVGEIVDVDGECGGYNLQWAWTSGAIVGEWI